MALRLAFARRGAVATTGRCVQKTAYFRVAKLKMKTKNQGKKVKTHEASKSSLAIMRSHPLPLGGIYPPSRAS
jgi:hypothetical protein